MNQLYGVFIDKLPVNIEQLLPTGEKFITFLNPYSLSAARKYYSVYDNFDYIASDGILPIWLNSLFHIKKSERFSFDMTGIAGKVFEYAISKGSRVYFWGTTTENIEKFLHVVRQNYPQLLIAGWHHGYVDTLEEEIWSDIQNAKADIVIIGMGTPKQDLMALQLKEKKYSGTVYTCGGFMHQTISKIDYYPLWVNRLNLRSLYRLYKEPKTIKRVLKTYPVFVVSYLCFLFKMKFCFKKGVG